MIVRILPLLALGAPLLSAGMAKHISSYDIKAHLDAGKKLLSGTETLTWLNDSPDTVATLQFHLYMNAFKNEKSTFMKESGGQLRGDRSNKKEWGWIDVKRMQLVGGADLTKSIRFIHPDDDNADDQTVIEVPLAQPVKPGQTIQVLIDFETKFPKVFARTGFHGSFLLAGQWFPKIGVWEKAGMRYSTQGQWNCHQFHAHSEFYSNFGRYRVELTVPSEYVIGATGEQKSRNDDAQAKTSTYVFEQEDVTDFAWTVQPNYIREERMFVADRETTPEELAGVARLHHIAEMDAALSDVKMIALVQPEHREQIDRHFQALAAGLKHFGLWYGRYPYKTITVVDPPYGGGGAGGMEYPTFITAGTSYRAPKDFLALEMVTVHEFGHQFWKELIASNEFEESWLDEGFNTYSTTKVMLTSYPRGSLPLSIYGFNLWRPLGLPPVADDTLNRVSYILDPVSDSIVRNAWSYYNGQSYSNNSYTKTGITLDTLEGILGSDVMARAMRTYHQRWRFNHPNSVDFAKVVSEVAGRDMNWFFDQFVFGNRLLDYEIGDVFCNEIKTRTGVFDSEKGRATLDEKEADKIDDANKKKMYETVVKIKRLGDGVAPVRLRVVFEDGSVEERDWDGVYRWSKFTFVKPSKYKSAAIDPDRKIELDVNWANNSRTAESDKVLFVKWTANLLSWAENALLWLSAMA